MDFAEKIKDAKELMKSLLLLGQFEIIPSFDCNYDLIIDKCFTVSISLNHHVKEINYPNRCFENNFFDLGSFTREEKGIVYQFIINGGTKIMLQEKKKQIEALKKEVESLELLLKTPPTNES